MNRVKTRLTILIMFSMILPTAIFSQRKEITIPNIPSSTQEFIQMRNKIATTPEGGAAILIASIMAFSKSKELGMACLTIALDSGNLAQGNSYKGYTPTRGFNYHLKRMAGYKRWPYMAFAYVKGGVASDGYAIKSKAPYTIVTSRNKYSGDESKGRVKIFVDVHGFRARPFIMRRNNKGHWKALGLSSLWLDVYPPKKAAKEEL